MIVYGRDEDNITNQKPLDPSGALDQPSRLGARGIVWFIALAMFAVLMADAAQYGIFRDEMYYIACGHHLAWGYVDQPPLIALFARLVTSVFGPSLYAIRLLPALAAFALVLLTGRLAQEMGGGRFAQGLAALCILIAPAYLAFDHLFTMNAFEPLIWMGGALLVLRILKTHNGKLWLWFGILAGFGMQNKNTELFFGFSVFVALLLTQERKQFREPWIWLGGLLALLVYLPNLLWQWHHGWPQLQILEATRAHRDIHLSPLQYFAAQALSMNPIALPIWLGGLWFLFFGRTGRVWCVLGWTFVVMVATFISLNAKYYYLWPVFPMLFAAGAVWIERGLTGAPGRWLKPAFVVLLVVSGALLVPLALPVLPPQTFLRYKNALGIHGTKLEHGTNRQALPQIFADMFGWKNMARQTAQVYNSLPPQDRTQACIFAWNYGDAGAIDFYGPRYGLPDAISGHNSFWLWGPGHCTGAVVIVIGGEKKWLQPRYANVEAAGTIASEWARDDETNLMIWLCRGPKFPSLQKIWPRLRHYD